MTLRETCSLSVLDVTPFSVIHVVLQSRVKSDTSTNRHAVQETYRIKLTSLFDFTRTTSTLVNLSLLHYLKHQIQ